MLLPSMPKLPSMPSMPTLPSMPSMPNLPSMPNMPGMPGMSALKKFTPNVSAEDRERIMSQLASFKKKHEYTIKKEIGCGSFGKVMMAKWRPFGQKSQLVALKVIAKEARDESDCDVDINDEIDNLRAIDHPHIVKLLDYYESKDNYYLAFQLATGGMLKERFECLGRWKEYNAAHVLRQILEAVACLHEHGIVHRDLKPQNILFLNKSDNSPIVIADFGVSKQLNDPEELIMGPAGTVGYCPPEVLKLEPFGLKVDCWSVGVIAYTLLCGYEPYMGYDDREVVWSIKNCPVNYTKGGWDKISPEAKDFCEKLLERNQELRWSAKEALQHPWLLSNCQGVYDLSLNMTYVDMTKKSNESEEAVNASNQVQSAAAPTTTNPEAVADVTPASLERPNTPSSEMCDDENCNYDTASEREPIGPVTPSMNGLSRSTSTLSFEPNTAEHGTEEDGEIVVEMVFDLDVFVGNGAVPNVNWSSSPTGAELDTEDDINVDELVASGAASIASIDGRPELDGLADDRIAGSTEMMPIKKSPASASMIAVMIALGVMSVLGGMVERA